MDLTPRAYVCPVHPNVRRLAPGVCAKCGAELTERGASRALFRSVAGHPLLAGAGLVLILAILAAAVWLLR